MNGRYARAAVSISLVVIGFLGLQMKVEYSGWILAIGLFVALDA